MDFEKKTISVSKTLICPKWEGDEGKTIHIDTPKTKSYYLLLSLTRQLLSRISLMLSNA